MFIAPKITFLSYIRQDKTLAMQTILKVENLSKKFGHNKAVDRVSFSIEKGKVYGILGPNGSGKSTTLGMLLNVVNKNEGNFQWFGGEIGTPQEALKKIGAIIERPNFYPNMSAVKNLELVCKIKECPTTNIEEKLKLVALYERKDDHFKTYSLGMKQRLAIASALLNNPEVLILDEPTNGLDPQGIHQIREIIHKIKATGTSILLASHLLEEVEKVCTDVIILKKGHKLYEGSVEEMNSGGIRIELGVVGANETLKNQLEAHPDIKRVKVKDDLLIITPQNDMDASRLNQYLFEQGFVAHHLKTQKTNLETAFLHLTNN